MMPMETPQGIFSGWPPSNFQRGRFLVWLRRPRWRFRAWLWPCCGRGLFEERPDVGGGDEFPALELGPEIIFEDVPGGFGVFGRIEGIFAGGAFAPAGDVSTLTSARRMRRSVTRSMVVSKGARSLRWISRRVREWMCIFVGNTLAGFGGDCSW